MTQSSKNTVGFILSLAASLATYSGCANVQTAMGIQSKPTASGAINNPFGDLAQRKNENTQGLILRTKKGDRSVEVEIPSQSSQISDFSIPVSPAFRENTAGARGLAGTADGDGTPDSSYRTKRPTQVDREIEKGFPQISGNEGLSQRSEIEKGLGLALSEDPIPAADFSYLAAIDQVKALFRSGRYEAALIESDSLIRTYPTSPRIYQMRGTLLEKIGQSDLALRNWKQALELEPKNLALRKFIERKEFGSQHSRSIASP